MTATLSVLLVHESEAEVGEVAEPLSVGVEGGVVSCPKGVIEMLMFAVYICPGSLRENETAVTVTERECVPGERVVVSKDPVKEEPER